MNEAEINSKLFKEYLEKTKEKYKYDYEKTNDDENMYKIYFDLQKEKFIRLEEKSIKLKKDYIENELLQKQNSLVTIYEQRRDNLDNIITNIDKLKNTYDKTIKEYKKDMINKIKIPFYLYTAKILQNYQQGMGVFLSTIENSDSMRFLTDSSSDHDAMHHLSSGQLAVVSFLLLSACDCPSLATKSSPINTIRNLVRVVHKNIGDFVQYYFSINTMFSRSIAGN